MRLILLSAAFICSLVVAPGASDTNGSAPAAESPAAFSPTTPPSEGASAAPVDDTAPTLPSLAPALECVSEADHRFKFVLSTRRNSTGHWIADMDVESGGGPLIREDHPLEVRLEHHTRTCAVCEEQPPSYARITLTEPPPLKTPTARGYRYYPGFGFYKRHMQKLNWVEARAVCQSEGADLVVINSVEEAKVLLELSAPMLYLQPSDNWNAEAFVGVSDMHSEGQFKAVTGQLLEDTGYVRWSPGEPNNHREEDCVTIVRNAMFNDVKCSRVFEFICEVEQ